MKDNYYSVLVVEDEILQRESFKKKIELYSNRFKVVYEAGNGSEALDYIKNHKVDVAFIDIVMPIMDGISFLQEASKVQENCYYVILSGYSEFEYAQKAMQFGAKDYLLKPVQSSDLSSILNKVLCLKTKNMETEIEGEIKALLSSKMSKGFADKYSKNHYRLALVHLGNMTMNYSYIQELDDTFDCLWNDINLKGCADRIAAEHDIPAPLIFPNEHPDESILVYKNDNIDDHDFDAFLLDLSNIINENQRFPRATVVYRSSRIQANMLYKTWRSLRKMYYEVCQPWMKQFIALSEDEVANDFNNMNVSAVFVEQAVHAFQSGNTDLAKTTLYKTLNKWRKNHFSYQQFYQNLQYFLKALRTKFINNENWDSLNKNIILYYTISASFDEFFENFFDLVSDFCMINNSDDSVNDILIKVKTYLEEHFNEQISLNDISDKFNISPSHLSRKFKGIYGESPINYLIKTRIDWACRNIRQFPDMEMKYVGELSGYTDYFYFSKVFKKYMGCSPSKYKELQQKTII